MNAIAESLDPVRPRHLQEKPVPPIPVVDESKSELASTTYSHYRTGLSNHRTGLSEHRTQLSEYRTDLSTKRTRLSVNRTEMSMRRTGMSFQRTRMSADRTLMSVIRTALSLISFGFTIYQFFGKLHEAEVVGSSTAPRNFGTILVFIGIGLLVIGILYHVQFMRGLRFTRDDMKGSGLIHGQSVYPVSYSLLTALALLALGLFAVVSMVLRAGPLG
jgi:uncharacterized membrane protein YidH (DUF202 family)